jgi:hypothetical protein
MFYNNMPTPSSRLASSNMLTEAAGCSKTLGVGANFLPDYTEEKIFKLSAART